MNTRPLILISNDDGYDAKGINDLANFVRDLGDIIIVAPDGGRSGTAMAMTSASPVRVKKVREEEGLQVYACSGTPCDCVKLAFEFILPRRPDIVLAGINHGDNAAVNVHYSGTMGVVIEGMMKHVASVGFSSCKRAADADFSALRPYIHHIVAKVLAEGLPNHVCLNVNFPERDTFGGVKICSMDAGQWLNEWEKRTDPHGRDYYWLTGNYETPNANDATTDRWALDHGFVAITPIQLDMTAYRAMALLKNYF